MHGCYCVKSVQIRSFYVFGSGSALLGKLNILLKKLGKGFLSFKFDQIKQELLANALTNLNNKRYQTCRKMCFILAWSTFKRRFFLCQTSGCATFSFLCIILVLIHQLNYGSVKTVTLNWKQSWKRKWS